MKSDRTSPRDQVAELREAFDRSFADAPLVDVAPLEALLDVRCGSIRYALRLADIAGLVVNEKITPVSGPIRELLGITGVRGSILPVYDLGALLGHPAGPTPRWIAIAAGTTPVGLALTRFECHLRVRADAIVTQDGSEAASHHVRQVVHLEAGARPVVCVASILDAIANRVRTIRQKE